MSTAPGYSGTSLSWKFGIKDKNMIRELALPLGFVDVNVCAVTDVWSGPKLVVRKTLP